jgi:hypothetical protein
MNKNQLKTQPTRDLLSLFASVMEELRRREVVRSSNNPVADYTEWLVARSLSLKLRPGSSTGFDAEDKDGKKYEIKGRRLTAHNGSTQLSAIRGLELRHFDYLVGVLFEPDFTVKRACMVPHDEVVRAATYRKHVNAWILHLKPSIWSQPGVQDVTDVLSRVQSEQAG